MSEQLNASRVLILLSMYNGERFINEQLDSLLNQTVPVDIVIRDDGSTDDSVNIVESYISKYKNIKLIKGQNIGFVDSFNQLMLDSSIDEHQWIAFCDQDDVWLPRKLETAIKKLSVVDSQNMPLMYCSNLEVVDSGLKHIRYMHLNKNKVEKSCIFVQNIATGCTVVFNYIAAYMYRRIINIHMVAHDYTMHCICKFLGNVVYDFNSYIKYRQHEYNSIGASSVTINQGIKNIFLDIKNPQIEKRILFFSDFISVFYTDIDDDVFKSISSYTTYKNNLLHRMNLVFNPYIKGYESKATIAFKLRALVGRMY